MNFLKKLEQYPDVCIQCHNAPDSDTIGAAFGVYRYLTWKGIPASMVYGGETPIKKYNLKLLLSECGIPLRFIRRQPKTSLLLVVDAQYGNTNVETFDAPETAIIDHHIPTVPDHELYLIRPEYQSCSTMVWELLKEEGYPVENDHALCTALLYGLYIDTSSFSSLYHDADVRMKLDLMTERNALFERLTMSNMSIAEMMIATDAMHNHYLDIDRRFAIISALKCEQSVLGVIGDFMIQIDMVNVCIAYTQKNDRYQFSIRSCIDDYPANEIAAAISNQVGGGGGHLTKAGGGIQISAMEQIFGDIDIFDLIYNRMIEYFNDAQSNPQASKPGG